jgi:pimeloyl-ACP methyl ester carboxylesterase
MNYKEHRYNSHEGLSLYYREYGQGEQTIICLPGLTRNSKDFHEIASHLSSNYRVLCSDLRGRGQSDHDPKWKNYHPGTYVKDIWKLLDEMGISNIIILGTSLGGLMAMIMAEQRPEHVKAVIMNDIGPQIDPSGYKRILSYAGRQNVVTNWQEAAQQCSDTYALAIPDMPMSFWAEYARRNFAEDKNGMPVSESDPNIGEAIRNSVKFTTWLKCLRKWGILRKIDGVMIDPWDSFKTMSMPCLVIRGELSDILSEEIVDMMHSVKPDLQRATIPKRGHVPLLDEAESIHAIDSFLAGLPTQGA